MVKALVLLAPGFEEIEALTPIDFLRRAGVEVTIASVCHDDLLVRGSHEITVKADVKFADVRGQLFDALICPGGLPGTTNLAKTKEVLDAIIAHNNAGKIVAAICAAPGLLFAEAAKILKGKNACGYPGPDQKITENGGNRLDDLVTVDGNIVTSRAAGTAFKFALKLIELLCGAEKAQDVGKGTLSI